jgi:LmbE family N-acetylglucosaminyl deacetylase
MTLNSESRLLLIAPHPDDESLACSVVLQRAVRDGATIRVIYATDGDDNPWPQRVLERKWRISDADRKRWGKLRRSEALAALGVLGLAERSTEFLALPDQGLTNLLRTDCRSVIERFAEIIRTWSPTHLLVPSILDTHPDHSALGVILRLALAEIFEPWMSVSSYAVHGKSAAFSGRAEPLLQTPTETEKKLEAILCHKSQIMLSRKRFLSYAGRPERLARFEPIETAFAEGPVRAIARDKNALNVAIRISPKLIRSGETALFLLGRDLNGAVRCLKARLPVRSSEIHMFECDSPCRLSADYRGNAFAGEFTIPIDCFSAAHALFFKLERRSLFFDEVGWLELASTVSAQQTESLVAVEPSFAVR